MLKIINTLTGKKQSVIPLKNKTITLYVCGITPYDYPHIGHGRVYVMFDLLYRLLVFLGYHVIYCRNFTDIDDKLLKKAEEQFGNQARYHEIARHFIDAFHEDLAALHCLTPTYEPLVTEHIPEIITFITGLLQTGKAYRVNGDIYFSIEQFPDYGKLSKQHLEQLRAGQRVEINEAKKDPLDFALWKSEPEGTFWKSPWGYGRPGWHIECSALAKRYLGDQVDMHGGGMDLIFPHHENEIAQSEGLTGKPFVHLWMHCAFVRINKEKMSKSLGNFFTLREVFRDVDPMVLRFYYLSHHYRSPLDFSFEDLAVAQKTYQKLCLFFAPHTCNKTYSQDELITMPVIKEMLEFLQDDLNTPGMFGVLFTYIHKAPHDEKTIGALQYFLNTVLGLSLQPLPEKQVAITPEIQTLLDQREAARVVKDWARADQLRKQLEELGINVHDKKINKP